MKNLVEEALSLLLGKRLLAFGPHVLLEVVLEVLEDEIELLLRVDDLLEPTKIINVSVLKFCLSTDKFPF